MLSRCPEPLLATSGTEPILLATACVLPLPMPPLETASALLPPTRLLLGACLLVVLLVLLLMLMLVLLLLPLPMLLDPQLVRQSSRSVDIDKPGLRCCFGCGASSRPKARPV